MGGGVGEGGARDFRKARQASPSIIFFDEVDALVPRRGMYMGSSHVTESVVSQNPHRGSTASRS